MLKNKNTKTFSQAAQEKEEEERSSLLIRVKCEYKAAEGLY